MTTEVLPFDPACHEYYCYDCKQLRLNASGTKAEACGNCGSANIQSDQVGSPYLSDLRERLASSGKTELSCKVCLTSREDQSQRDCGKPAKMLINGIPMCSEHIEDWAQSGYIYDSQPLEEKSAR
jgi:hypothetical protein